MVIFKQECLSYLKTDSSLPLYLALILSTLFLFANDEIVFSEDAATTVGLNMITLTSRKTF